MPVFYGGILRTGQPGGQPAVIPGASASSTPTQTPANAAQDVVIVLLSRQHTVVVDALSTRSMQTFQ